MTHTDIKMESWIFKLPLRLQPYAVLMRLDRPVGWWLLLLPGWWGILMATGGVRGFDPHDLGLFVLFFLGAVIMRGAGCVINDVWDRDLDKQVTRTKTRPIASGKISVRQALLFMLLLLIMGFCILLLMPRLTIILGVLSLFLVISYPLMKRITWWPQAFLGLTFNFGALMGYSAVTGDISFSVLCLYLAGIFWTLGYDTIYAHQDKEDDAMIGIKSTALLFGTRSKIWVSGFYLSSIFFLTFALWFASAGLLSFLLLCAPMAHFYYQIKKWDMDCPESSLYIFKSNYYFGLLVLLPLAAI